MRHWSLFFALFLCFTTPVFGAVELDADSNGATDVGKGGTNSTTAAGARTNLGVPATASTLAGSCTVGPCLDGTSDGGDLIKLYGPGGFWTALQAGNAVANRSWRLPLAAPPTPGTTRLMNMDEDGQMGFVDPAIFQPDLAVPSQAEAEGGTATTERVWTAERVKQAIEALGGSGTIPDGTIANMILQWDGDSWEPTSSVAGLIDDTAGDGDTDKLLSADKVVELVAAGTGTTYTAGTGIDITADVISATGTPASVVPEATGTVYKDDPACTPGEMLRSTTAVYMCGSAGWLSMATLTDDLGNAPVGVSDDFSSDTSADYTAIDGGISVSGGTAGGSGTWAKNLVYHESTLGTANQEVSASVTYNGATDSAGVLARVSTGTPKTGYIAYFGETGKVLLSSFSGTTVTPITTYIGSYASGTYTIKLSVSGTTVKVYVGGVERISVTDSTYSAGDYIGLIFDRDNADYDARADDLLGVAL